MHAPTGTLQDFTVPDPGSSTLRKVYSRAIGRLLRELRPLVRRHARGDVQEGLLSLGATLDALVPGNVGPVASLLRRPNVGALVRVLGAAPPGEAAGLALELGALLSLELAAMGLLSRDVSLPRGPARMLSLLSRVSVEVPEGSGALRFTNGRLTVGGGEGPATLDLARLEGHPWVKRPYREVSGDVVLALADNNPLAMIEAHPDKSGNAVDLGGKSEDEWVSALRGALEIIGRDLPEFRAEMDVTLSQLVPVGHDAEKHLSASYQEAIGTVYLTLHPDPMTMAEALIHEASHNKLNALFELDRVLENAHTPLFTSPVRPDPRPLHGVLLAVHAFVPVARLYERMIAREPPHPARERLIARFREIVRGNHEGTALLLEHARPTALGRGLFEELGKWDAHYAGGP